MTNRKIIYINPGDMLEIRFIHDPDAPKNKKEWENQLHSSRYAMCLTIPDGHTIHTADYSCRVAYTSFTGEIKRWLQ